MEKHSLDGLLSVGGFKVVGVRDALRLITSGAVLVDLREPYLTSYKKFDVSSVLYMPLSKLETLFCQLPLDKLIILADSSGNHIREVGLRLLEKPSYNFVVLGGGMVDWERMGGPVAIDKNEELTGSCICQMRKPKST